MSAYRTNRPARYVEGGQIAMPEYKPIPINMRNLNKRTNFDSTALNHIRHRGWGHVSRNNVIKFVMNAYFMAWWVYREEKNNTARKQLHNFDMKYMNISTRERGNHSMITPVVLWNKLQRLTRVELVKFAKIIEW